MSELVVTTTDDLRALIRQEFQELLQSIKPTQKEPSEIMNIGGFCELTEMARQTAYYYHHKKMFPPGVCTKRGKRLYFSRSATLAWIKGK